MGATGMGATGMSAAGATGMGATGMAATNTTMQTTMQSTMGSTQQDFTPAPLHIRVTADHRACADLFALYTYSMYRRRELVRMWQTLTEAYEKGMDVFAELLTRNPALKPMIDTIAAQLKRGAVVGYDKAFIAKQQKPSASQPGRIKPSDAEMFKTGKRRTAGQPGAQDTMANGEEPTSPKLGQTQ